jgi:hypothetical protein
MVVMARKPAAQRAITSAADKKGLSQFQPPIDYELYSVDIDSGRFQRFSPAREQEIDRVLGEFISPHARDAEWNGRPCSIERFVDNAKEAIARYETTRDKEGRFDRAAATPLLQKACSNIEAAATSLGEIAAWRELDGYLTQIFLDRCEMTNPGIKAGNDENPADAIVRQLSLENKREAVFRSFSPAETMMQLRRLATVINLAADKTVFAPGDWQRDWIARDFAHEMLFAWFSATGTLPAAAKSNKSTVQRSPFIRLLEVTNSLIVECHRHPTDFREYAIKAVAEKRA